jgi:hypothetical protein
MVFLRVSSNAGVPQAFNAVVSWSMVGLCDLDGMMHSWKVCLRRVATNLEGIQYYGYTGRLRAGLCEIGVIFLPTLINYELRRKTKPPSVRIALKIPIMAAAQNSRALFRRKKAKVNDAMDTGTNTGQAR